MIHPSRAGVVWQRFRSARQITKIRNKISMTLTPTPAQGGKRPNKVLTVRKKLEVVEAVERDKKSYSFVAKQFEISKSSVGTIIKRKNELLEYKKQNRNLEYKKICMNPFSEELDQRVWKWFADARVQNILIHGEAIQAKALEVATILNPEMGFQASDGWLEKFKRRHNITLNQESRSMDQTVIENDPGEIESMAPQTIISTPPADETPSHESEMEPPLISIEEPLISLEEMQRAWLILRTAIQQRPQCKLLYDLICPLNQALAEDFIIERSRMALAPPAAAAAAAPPASSGETSFVPIEKSE
jgi:predicted DNA-binding protein YlxM (UPF0122 family)